MSKKKKTQQPPLSSEVVRGLIIGAVIVSLAGIVFGYQRAQQQDQLFGVKPQKAQVAKVLNGRRLSEPEYAKRKSELVQKSRGGSLAIEETQEWMDAVTIEYKRCSTGSFERDGKMYYKLPVNALQGESIVEKMNYLLENGC